MEDLLILDLSDEYRKFRDEMLPLFGQLRYREFADATLESIMEYIHGAKDGADMLQEFVDALEETMTEEGMTEEQITQIKEATLELGSAMLKHLLVIGAYDNEGHLGFKFKELLGDDIVLQPLGPADLADDDIDVNEVEDPGEFAQMRDQADLSTLYSAEEKPDDSDLGPYDRLAND